MSRIGVMKIFETLLIKEFPGIEDIKVLPISDDIKDKRYQVFIGLPPASLKEYGGDNIREYAKTLSQFVLDPGEKVMILFYNSEDRN